MQGKTPDITDLSKEELIRLVGIFMGDVLVHYGMWFSEVARSGGIETALNLDSSVLQKYYSLAAARIAPHFGIEMDGKVPRVLANKSQQELLLLIADIAKTWLVSDGLWFQAVEDSFSWEGAKKVNDTCWSHFAKGMDPRIRTECVWCPPDRIPDEEFCAWRFSLET